MAHWIYTLIITTYFFNKNGFSCVWLFSSLRAPFSSPSLLISSTSVLLRPLPVVSLFFSEFFLGKPRTLTLHLTFGSAVYLLYHFTTVICWDFPSDKLFLSLPANYVPKLQRPPGIPRAYPGHLTVHRARGGGNLNVALKGWGIWTGFISCSGVICPWVFSGLAGVDGFTR